PRVGTRADWETFQAVAQGLGAKWNYRTAEDVFREIARLVPGYERQSWATLLPLGPQWSLNGKSLPARVGVRAASGGGSTGEGFWLLSGGTLFLQGSLSLRTEVLPRLYKEPRAF